MRLISSRPTQSAYTTPQDLDIRRNSDHRDPKGDGHARHSMSIVKDSPTPVRSRPSTVRVKVKNPIVDIVDLQLHHPRVKREVQELCRKCSDGLPIGQILSRSTSVFNLQRCHSNALESRVGHTNRSGSGIYFLAQELSQLHPVRRWNDVGKHES